MSVAMAADTDSACYIFDLLHLCGVNAQFVDGQCECLPPWLGENCDDDSDIYGNCRLNVYTTCKFYGCTINLDVYFSSPVFSLTLGSNELYDDFLNSLQLISISEDEFKAELVSSVSSTNSVPYICEASTFYSPTSYFFS